MSEYSSKPLRSSLEASRSNPKSRSVPKRRWMVYGGVALLAVLVIAWIDGGEEAIRPIEQPVALPTADGNGQ